MDKTVNRDWRATEYRCALDFMKTLLGGKWKKCVLCSLSEGTKGYKEMERDLDGVSQKMLSANLKEMEKDYLLTRTVIPTIPIHTKYNLTERGKEMSLVLQTLRDACEGIFPFEKRPTCKRSNFRKVPVSLLHS